MGKVYLVMTHIAYEGDEVAYVASSLEKAEAWANNNRILLDRYDDSYIEEIQVDA